MKYRTYFTVKFDGLPQEDTPVKNIKQALQMLREIDTEKSKCRAAVVIIKGE